VRLRRPKGERRVTLFDRAEGVVCYEAAVFSDEGASRAFGDALGTTAGLTWYWGSELGPAGPVRSLTRLSSADRELFANDIAWRDVGEDPSFVVLGMDAGIDATGLPLQELLRLRDRFARHEEGPIRIVIAQPGDMREDYTFVPHHPVDPIADLLRRLAITTVRPKRTRYRWLHTMRLEEQTWDWLAVRT
jgi:hypothetical protein